MEKKKKCIGTVCYGFWGKRRPCRNNALIASKFCWVHDPEKIKQRREEENRKIEESNKRN